MEGDETRRGADRRRDRERCPMQLRWIAQARALTAVLDALPNALLLVTSGNPVRIWHATSAARRVLASGGLLTLVDDRLVCASPHATKRLEMMLDRALQDAAGHSRECSLPADDEGQLLTFRVEALDWGASRDLPVDRLALVEVVALPVGVLGALCREFGLTRGEAETALRLHATGSVAGIAAQASRSVHTVRTQLKAAMAKTGTHSQAGLVALLGNRLTGHALPPVRSTPSG